MPSRAWSTRRPSDSTSGEPHRLQVVEFFSSDHLQQVGQQTATDAVAATLHSLAGIVRRFGAVLGRCHCRHAFASRDSSRPCEAWPGMAISGSRNSTHERGVSRIDDTNPSRPAPACMQRRFRRPASCGVLARDPFANAQSVAQVGRHRHSVAAVVANARSLAHCRARRIRFRAEFRDVRVNRDGVGSRRSPVLERHLRSAPQNAQRRSVVVGGGGAAGAVLARE